MHNCWIYTFIGHKHLLHTYVCRVYIYIDITVVGLISGCSALHYWIILDIQKGYIGQTRSHWILKGYTGRNIVGSTYWTIWILKGQFTFIFFIEIRKISLIIFFFFWSAIWLPQCQLWATVKGAASLTQCFFFLLFLITIDSMQGWTVTTRHGVTRKRSKKRLEHTEYLFR